MLCVPLRSIDEFIVFNEIFVAEKDTNSLSWGGVCGIRRDDDENKKIKKKQRKRKVTREWKRLFLSKNKIAIKCDVRHMCVFLKWK